MKKHFISKAIMSITIISLICMAGCGSDGAKEKKSNKTEQESSSDKEQGKDKVKKEKTDDFVMDHKIRTGFIREKVDDIDPDNFIEIETADDLRSIKDSKDGSYILMNDIDMTGESWSRIDFDGCLEGNYHVIKGLNKTLFGYFDGTVNNLGLEDVQLEDAAIADTMSGGRISNCYVTGEIQGSGGLVKCISSVYTSSGTSANIEYCYNAANIKEESYEPLGGITGKIDLSVGPYTVSIYNCENYGTLYGSDEVGGIAGYIVRGTSPSGSYNNSNISCRFNRCFNYGEVNSDEYAGGIFGYLNCGNGFSDYENTYEVSACANHGKIIRRESDNPKDGTCAGLCGRIDLRTYEDVFNVNKIEVSDCLNTGEVDNQGVGGAICGRVDISYGTCNIKRCLMIGKSSNECNYNSSMPEKQMFNSEDCYSTGDFSKAEMKDIKKNLQTFDYPYTWGINELYCGFPHPYGIDESESVIDYYEQERNNEAKQMKKGMKEDEIKLYMRYADILEGIYYTGYWAEDDGNEEYLEALMYNEDKQAFYDILDVNNDDVDDLVVKLGEWCYKVYNYDFDNESVSLVDSYESSDEWMSAYGEKTEPDWKVMEYNNYGIYKEVYELWCVDDLMGDLNNDMGVIFVNNDYDFDKTLDEISSTMGVEIETDEEYYSKTGTLNGETIIDVFEESGGSICYQKAADGITMFGVKPGISEEELIDTITKYGFYKGRYNYKIGSVMLYYIVEDGVVTQVSMSSGSEYVG